MCTDIPCVIFLLHYLVDSKSVKELEADLKRIVLGDNKHQQQERSAFDKLVNM